MLLDGAVGTELGRRGVDLSTPLWSARALLDAPDILSAIHREFLEAGADAVTTCTFRTHQRSLAAAGLGERARDLARRAVEIARQARDETNPNAVVLGSIGPLEDCYEPERAPASERCRDEHERAMRDLCEAGVDALLIETMGTQREIAAAIHAAERVLPGRWLISMLTTSAGPPGMLISGESLMDLAPLFAPALAVGVNCIAAPAVLPQVRLLRRMMPESMRIMAYANVGKRTADGTWSDTEAVDPSRYAALAEVWMHAGVSIIGGCCGTTPATIVALAERLRTRGNSE